MIAEVEAARIPSGTFTAGLTGDVAWELDGDARFRISAATGLLIELNAAVSRSSILLSCRDNVAAGNYSIWGDECGATINQLAPDDLVFRINGQGSAPEQWTLSAHSGVLTIEYVDGGSIVGHFEACTCGESLGSDHELTIALCGRFYALRTESQ